MDIKFTNFLRKFNFGKKNNTELISAHKDWRILFAGFSILFLVILLFSMYLFYAAGQGDIFQVTQTEEVKVDSLSRDSLDKVIQVYEVKKDKLETLRYSPRTSVDPSL